MKFVRVAVVLIITASLAAVFLIPRFEQSLQIQKYLKEISSRSIAQKPYPYPVKNQKFVQAPQIFAKSAVVLDAKTGDILFEKDANFHLLPASTIKLMTALVALQNCPPDKVVTVTQVETEPTLMGLATGDQLTVESLINGLLIVSGNDAAFTLAYSCAPSVDEFVSQMNTKAKQLGMENTHFTNPIGFDNTAQFSSAKDLARLAQAAIGNPLIAKIVATQSTVVTNIRGTKSYYLDNVNKLLGQVEGIEGIKTGQTEGALGNLVTKTTRGGNTIITVILGSKDRFGETKTLIEWTFANYHWVNP